MLGCHIGRFFQVTVAGGSYQEGLTSVIQGVPPGIQLSEQEIYGDLLLRKPGADELSSPRKEPDLPIIYSGLNAADTIENAGNKNHTNGTPLTILIPNLDRDFIHIKQYQDTNRTPRPGHSSYASFIKYGPDDDAIGAGFFSGRYTSTIVAAGSVAKKVLKKFGIEVFGYVKEIAGVRCPDVPHEQALNYTNNYKRMRRDLDPFYQEIYVKGRVTMDMRFLEKAATFAQIEKEIDAIREKTPKVSAIELRAKYGVHPILNSPDINAAQAMVDACNRIAGKGDSAGGVVEVVVTGEQRDCGDELPGSPDVDRAVDALGPHVLNAHPELVGKLAHGPFPGQQRPRLVRRAIPPHEQRLVAAEIANRHPSQRDAIDREALGDHRVEHVEVGQIRLRSDIVDTKRQGRRDPAERSLRHSELEIPVERIVIERPQAGLVVQAHLHVEGLEREHAHSQAQVRDGADPVRRRVVLHRQVHVRSHVNQLERLHVRGGRPDVRRGGSVRDRHVQHQRRRTTHQNTRGSSRHGHTPSYAVSPWSEASRPTSSSPTVVLTRVILLMMASMMYVNPKA